MAVPLNIVLNGVEKSFDELGEAPSITALVAALGFRADRVALERNGDIVPRATWPETMLHAGDQIELVHFVGGGSKGASA